MFGNRKLLGLLLLLGACGTQKMEDEVTRRRLIGMIDDRQYQKVTDYLQTEASAQQRTTFRGLEAQAEMGMGGFEVLSVFSDVKGELGFRREAFKAMSNGCPTQALKTQQLERLATRCLIVRFFNSLPLPDQPHLIRARELWHQEIKERGDLMTSQDRLLAATFEASLILARAGKVLGDYYQISANAVSADEVDGLFNDIHTAAEDSRNWLENSMSSARQLNVNFLGLDRSAIFNSSISSHVEFALNSGLPKLLQISDLRNKDVEDRVFRSDIIKGLDNVLTDYFKVSD